MHHNVKEMGLEYFVDKRGSFIKGVAIEHQCNFWITEVILVYLLALDTIMIALS